jgi:hypothetical protein
VSGRAGSTRQVSTREEFTGPAHLAAGAVLVGYALRTWRARNGATLAVAARALGCTDGHLSRVERGVRMGPTPAHTAQALGVDPGFLMTPCPACGWNPRQGGCRTCGTAQSARQLAAEIVSWIVRGGL